MHLAKDTGDISESRASLIWALFLRNNEESVHVSIDLIGHSQTVKSVASELSGYGKKVKEDSRSICWSVEYIAYVYYLVCFDVNVSGRRKAFTSLVFSVVRLLIDCQRWTRVEMEKKSQLPMAEN